jgi:hypothetical protein
MFGVQVKIKDGIVTVSNIRRSVLLDEIQTILKTSRVNKHLFIDTSLFSVSFHEFFVLEFFYILEMLIKKRSHYLTRVRSLKAIQDALLEQTWLSKTEQQFPSRFDYRQLNRFHFQPLPHQKTFMEHYDQTVQQYSLKGLLLAAAPGTGKTYTTLAIAECLHADRIVVVCPKAALYRVWGKSVREPLRENDGLYKTPPSCWIADEKKPYKNERVVLFHYETINTAIEMLKQLKVSNTVVILDESHNLNEMVSLRTQRFLDLCEGLSAKDILFATGTPIKAMSVETIPLLKAIDPYFSDPVLQSFKKLYAGSVSSTTEILARRYNAVSFHIQKDVIQVNKPIEENIDVTIADGKRFTLKTIAFEMAVFMNDRLKELNKELPEATRFFYQTLDAHSVQLKTRAEKEAYATYRVSLDQVIQAYQESSLHQAVDAMRYCTQYEKRVILPMIESGKEKEAFKHAKTLVKYLKLKARGECLGRIVGRKRIEAYKAVVSGIDFSRYIDSTEKKSLVFTTYAEVVEECLRVLKEQDYEPIAVYGSFTKNLPSIVERFAKEEAINPLVATYASLSTAVPLIMADTMVVINPPFRQYIMEQTIARIRRLGATTQTRVFYVNLVTDGEPNISTRTIDIMKWSKDQVEMITGIKVEEEEDEAEDVVTEDWLGLTTSELIQTETKQPSFLNW